MIIRSLPIALALAALVAFCRVHGIALIDCQQKTSHLASLGAREIPRAEFVSHVAHTTLEPAPSWQFEPVYWRELVTQKP